MTTTRTLFGLLIAASAAACTAQADGNAATGQESAVTAAPSLFADKTGAGKTHYPIMLEHGFAASAEASSIWKFDGVADDLMAQGHVFVSAASVEPFNDVVARAATMEVHVRAVQAACATMPGCDPSAVHVIAHSFGGLHVREYLRQHPPSQATEQGLPRVLSLTTISTPHQGTAIADLGLKIIDAFQSHPSIEAIVQSDLDDLAGLIGRTFTKEELVQNPDVASALHDLSEANAGAFLDAHPAVDGVQYFTWAGVSENADVLLHPFHPNQITADFPSDCDTGFSYQEHAHATDALLSAAHDVSGHFLSGLPNDGMATVASAKGLPNATFMGCIPADHLAEVGYSTDEKRQWTGFDHKEFYRYVAAQLATLE